MIHTHFVFCYSNIYFCVRGPRAALKERAAPSTSRALWSRRSSVLAFEDLICCSCLHSGSIVGPQTIDKETKPASVLPAVHGYSRGYRPVLQSLDVYRHPATNSTCSWVKTRQRRLQEAPLPHSFIPILRPRERISRLETQVSFGQEKREVKL